MSKKKISIVPIVGTGIVLLALFVVLSSVLSPRMSANKAFRRTCETLTDTEQFDYVSVLRPLDQGPLMPVDTEVRLTDGDEINALRDSLLIYLADAKYGGGEEALGGNWDIRVRFHTGDTNIDLYLRNDDIYLSQKTQRYLFVPRDTEAYTAWRAQWLESLFDAQKGESNS